MDLTICLISFSLGGLGFFTILSSLDPDIGFPWIANGRGRLTVGALAFVLGIAIASTTCPEASG